MTSDSIGPTNLSAASMGPDVQRNANVSPKLHVYKNDILRGTTARLGSFLLETGGARCSLVQDQGETVVPYTTPTSTGQQQHVHGNVWFFVMCVENTDQPGAIVLVLTPLLTFQIYGRSIDTLSAPNLSLSTSCRARAPLEECKST